MKQVLVVEDDKLLGKAVATALEDAGYTVFVARNSVEAFEAIKTQTIDLVYLDIMLPDVDGFEILRQLKADATKAGIPVVMLSNSGQMKEINRAMEIGAMDYVVKANIDLEKLVELTKTKFLS